MSEGQASASVLLLDDGELDRVARMLDTIGMAYQRVERRGAGKQLPRPSELLVTSGRIALTLPAFSPPLGPDAPLWVCYHGQDFLPLRDQLRGLGVHYLVNSSVRQDTLRLFLLQLLRREPERRRADRLQLGLRAQCWVGSQLADALLVDLSPSACRVVLERKLAPGTVVRLVMPSALGKGARVEITGQVGRSLPAASGQPSWSTAIVFDVLPPEDRALLDRILAGATLGTPVSRLTAKHAERSPSPAREAVASAADAPASPPSRAAAGPQVVVASGAVKVSSERADERRERQRRAYSRKIAVLELSEHDSEGLALGCDLSPDGVRLTGCLPLEPGMKITLALYAGRREEPAVVEAVVLRKEAEGDFALRFCEPNPRQRKEIAALLAAAPTLQAVSAVPSGTSPVAVARLLDAA